jgi:YgiT-type zinc finger domain-containing protein
MDEERASEIERTAELAERMRQWRQANRQATLTEIEQTVEAELAQLRRQLVEAMVHETAEGDSEVPHCPVCGQAMVKNGRRKRKLHSKEGQTIQLERQQWRCLACGTTLFPPG